MTAARQRKAAPSYTLATLFGLGKEIGLMPDDAKEMAYSLVGKDSLKKFTQKEINTVCFEMMARKDGQKHRPGHTTDQQLYRIREYERLLGWDSNPLRLAAFVEKTYHVASVLWLTTAQASKFMNILERMLTRQQKEAVSDD